jgi:hypothetical protein
VVGQVLEQAGTLGEHVGAKARISFKESLHWLASIVFAFSCSSVDEPRRGDGCRVKTRRLSGLSARSALPWFQEADLLSAVGLARRREVRGRDGVGHGGWW